MSTSVRKQFKLHLRERKATTKAPYAANDNHV